MNQVPWHFHVTLHIQTLPTLSPSPQRHEAVSKTQHVVLRTKKKREQMRNVFNVFKSEETFVSTSFSSLTFNIQERRSLKVLGVAGVRLGVIEGAVFDDQLPLATIGHHLVLLGFMDFLSVSEPLDVGFLSGQFALEDSRGLFLDRLILQGFGELDRRL